MPFVFNSEPAQDRQTDRCGRPVMWLIGTGAVQRKFS